MNKALRLILAIALLVAVVGQPASATKRREAPQGPQGSFMHPLYSGYDYAYLSNTTEKLVCTGTCLLHAVIMGTGAIATGVLFRDTDTADNGNVILMVPELHFSVTASSGNLQRVEIGLVTNNGIAVDLTSVSAGEDITVLYLDLDTE